MSGPRTPKHLCTLAAACALAGACGPGKDLADEPPGGGARVTGETPSYLDIALPRRTYGKGISFSPDGRLVATALASYEPFVADVRTGRKLPGFKDGILPPSVDKVTFSPDGRYLAGVKSALKARHAPSADIDDVKPIDINDVEAYLDQLKGPFRANVVLWDAGTGAEVKRLAKHDGSISRFCFTRDGKRLATASSDGTAVVWDVATGARVRTFRDGRFVRSVAFSPDGTLLVTRARWGSPWGGDEERILMTLKAMGRPAARRPAIVVWEVASGGKLREMEEVRVVFPPGDPYVATCVRRKGVTLRDAGSWKAVREIPCGDSIQFSPDGRLIAAKKGVWDVATGRQLASWKPGLIPFVHCSFSPDSKLFAVDTGENLLLWDVGTGRRLVSCAHPMWSAYALAFSPDGAHLAESKKGAIRLWRVEDLLAAAPQRPARPPGPPKARASTGDPAVDRIVARLREYDGISFGVWNSLTHAAARGTGKEKVLAILDALETCRKGDLTRLKKLGGLAGIKRELKDRLKSKDPIVRSGAALLIGLVGDKGLAPDVAGLLGKWTGSVPPEVAEIGAEGVDRCSAAEALGLLGATEYAARLAELVSSDEADMIRGGAAAGLGLMRAREHAKAVAGLLDAEEGEAKAAGVGALAQMGAKEYAPKIAKLLDEDLLDFELNQEAAYALAALGAREHAKDIATLLDGKFSQGEAAKALAFLDATEYAPKIAGLLKDKSSLVRKDALIALGLMGARQCAGKVAAALDDDESSIVSAAVVSLLLMDAGTHTDRIVAVIDGLHHGRIPLSSDDVPMPEVYQRALDGAKKSLAKMRGR